MPGGGLDCCQVFGVVRAFMYNKNTDFLDRTLQGDAVAPNRRKITVQPGQPPKEAELVEVTNAQENWNQYLLSDGSVLKTKAVVTEVWRVIDEYDADGNPSYVLRTGGIMVVNAPDSLRKPQ